MNKDKNFNYKRLHPFKWFILENYPFLEDSIDVLTNYQLFCKLGEMYNKEIDAINMLGIQVEGITDWFDNLDVQEEINNKLDEMTESGELEEIIAAYINTNALICFDNVESLKSSENLVDGSYAKTLGFYEKNDGGSAVYKIRNITNNDVVDEMFILALTNSEDLIAELIYGFEINVKQLGAKGDGETDDSSIIQAAIDYAESKKYDTSPNSLSYIGYEPIIYFPTGTYLISQSLESNSKYLHLKGNDSIITTDDNTENLLTITANGYNHTIDNIQFLGGYNQIEYDDDTNTNHSKIFINNCQFWLASNYALKIKDQSCKAIINETYFYQNKFIYESTMIDSTTFNDCWFSDGTTTTNNGYSFKLISGQNTFNNCFFIPNGVNELSTSYTEICWIENHAMLTIDNCRISNERGAKTLINNYAKLSFDPTVQAHGGNSKFGVINVINNPILATYSTHPLIRLFEMPRSINILNNNFTTENFKFIDFSSSFVLADFISNGYGTGELSSFDDYTINYNIQNNSVSNHLPYTNVPLNLAEFIKCDREITFTFTSTMEIPYIHQSIGNNNVIRQNFLVKAVYRPDTNSNSASSIHGILGFDIQDGGKITCKFELLNGFQGGNSTTQGEAISITPTFKTNNTNQVSMASNTYVDLSMILTISSPFNTGVLYSFKKI